MMNRRMLTIRSSSSFVAALTVVVVVTICCCFSFNNGRYRPTTTSTQSSSSSSWISAYTVTTFAASTTANMALNHQRNHHLPLGHRMKMMMTKRHIATRPSQQQQQQQPHRSTVIRQASSGNTNKGLTTSSLSSLSSTALAASVVVGGSDDTNENNNNSNNNKIPVSFVSSIASALSFVLLDVVFRQWFVARHITSFPSSLAACGTVFGSLLLLQQLPPLQRMKRRDTMMTTSSSSSKRVADVLFTFLQPGAAVFAKWLPVFFVPSLITLPLTDDSVIGNSIMEMMKILSVIIVGFFFTLLTTSYSVLLVRNYSNNNNNNNKVATSTMTTTTSSITNAVATTTTSKPTRPNKVFSDALFHILCLSAASTGVGTVLITRGHSIILTKIFLLCTTLCTFVFGARLPNPIKQVIHPLVTCTALTWTTMAGLATILPTLTFRSILHSYKVGKGITGSFTSTGPGDVLLYLLGPAVVSLAISMYEKRLLMKQNIIELCTAISVSTFGGLYGTAFAVRFWNIASPYLRLSLLSRNITSPLAMAIASILGGDVSIAVSIVVVTGLFGANFGAMILNAFGIHDPVARGLGIGAAAHGLGTAAFTDETDAFPFAAISMALTASAATIAVSIPFIKNSLLRLAMGA